LHGILQWHETAGLGITFVYFSLLLAFEHPTWWSFIIYIQQKCLNYIIY
jgi:hypothetical protein